jgi:dihydrofolate reductase
MRKIVVTEFISIDGVVEDPHLWHFEFWSDEMGDFKLNEVRAADALLLGRVTYDGFAAAWPGRTDEAGFADKYNSMPKYVVSTTIGNPEWNNSHVIRDNVAEEVAKLKDGGDGEVQICGSLELINSLLDADVIDEYRLMVHPIVVGHGKRLFGDHEASKSLDLVKTESLPNGVMVLTYAAKPASASSEPTPA